MIHRVTVEVEVPVGCTATSVQVITSSVLTELSIRNRARIIYSREVDSFDLPDLATDGM